MAAIARAARLQAQLGRTSPRAKVSARGFSFGHLDVFYSLREAEVLIESWRRHFKTVRPHSSLGYIPPAPETVLPRSGTVALWPGSPALEGAPPANSDVAIKPVLY